MKKNLYAVELGRLGGKKGGVIRAQKLSSEQRKEIAQKAARVRWAKKDQLNIMESNKMTIWKKKLTRSDAQQETQGARMPFLRFTKGNLSSVDHTTYFREDFFAQADWQRATHEAERISIMINVKLPMHAVPVQRQMSLDFDPNRGHNHSAPTVHLLYDNNTRDELENEDLTDREVVVSSVGGCYSLTVE